MEVSAQSKYIRIAPRKAALVSDGLRGLPPQEAMDKLQFIAKSAAVPLSKIIKSALANAQENAKLKAEDLKIKKVEVLKGPSFKRWRPVSRGRAHSYKKRTSHIKITLEAKS